MKKLVLTLSMVAFAVAMQAGENCATACAAKAKATAATCNSTKATAATCNAAKAKASTCATACNGQQTRKADATAKGATQLAKR